MKLDRMIGILSVLLQRDKVTTPYLAEKFEVSRRTSRYAQLMEKLSAGASNMLSGDTHILIDLSSLRLS